jgi:hypothetical protein
MGLRPTKMDENPFGSVGSSMNASRDGKVVIAVG